MSEGARKYCGSPTVATNIYAPFESMSPRPVSFAINNIKDFDRPIGRTRRESFSVVIQLSIMLSSRVSVRACAKGKRAKQTIISSWAVSMGIGSEVVVDAWAFKRVKGWKIWAEKRRRAYHPEDWKRCG